MLFSYKSALEAAGEDQAVFFCEEIEKLKLLRFMEKE
jgi:hypothetical protein